MTLKRLPTLAPFASKTLDGHNVQPVRASSTYPRIYRKSALRVQTDRICAKINFEHTQASADRQGVRASRQMA